MNNEDFLVIHLVKNVEQVEDEQSVNDEKNKINRFILSIDQFEKYLNEENSSSSIRRSIILLDKDLSFDEFNWKIYPQISAVFTEEFRSIFIDEHLKNSIENFLDKSNLLKKPAKIPSKFFVLWKKYWFLFGLSIVICLSYLFPNVGKTGGFIRSEWTVKWFCVMIIFFLSGLTLKTKDLKKEIVHIRLHLFIQLFSFIIIPTFIYLFCFILKRFSFNSMLIIGLIILGSTSTTISSNVVMTKNAGGNDCGALVNAVLGNLMGIFISPGLISFLLTKTPWNRLINEKSFQFQFEYFHVIFNLCLTVLLPLILGQIIHSISTEKILRFKEKFYFAELNSLALLTLIWSVFSTAFAKKSFDLLPKKDLFILILFNIFIYLFSSFLIFVFARLPMKFYQYSKRDTITMIFCGATKTLAMGIPLINALFSNESNQQMISLISLPLIIYHVTQLILGAFQVIILKHWIDKSSPNIISTI